MQLTWSFAYVYLRDFMHQHNAVFCGRKVSVRLTVRPYVCLSVCLDPVLCQNGYQYTVKNYITNLYSHYSNRCY